jgi:hypothetical protein
VPDVAVDEGRGGVLIACFGTDVPGLAGLVTFEDGQRGF